MANQSGAATAKATKTLGGKRYKKVSCSKTKMAAAKVAKGIREKGGTARVVKSGSAHCVYQGPKSKVKRTKAKATTARRKTTARSTTRRKAKC